MNRSLTSYRAALVVLTSVLLLLSVAYKRQVVELRHLHARAEERDAILRVQEAALRHTDERLAAFERVSPRPADPYPFRARHIPRP